LLIDAHCHLDDEAFANDLDAVITRAVEAGVSVMVSAGTDVASSRAAIGIAEKYESVYAAVGIHPHYADRFSDDTLKEIRVLAQHPRVVAIGEIGLDFHYADNPPRAVQERNFEAHLDLAQEQGKPVVIHDRDAHAALMEILTRRQGAPRAMLHCFSGDLEMARQAIAFGHYVSFAGNLTFRNAQALVAVARALPLERLLVETDAPYLSPRRGRRNEPAYVVLVAHKIAELHNVETQVVEETTRQNSQDLFGLQKVRRL
jgi:TatD DNase family protein